MQGRAWRKYIRPITTNFFDSKFPIIEEFNAQLSSDTSNSEMKWITSQETHKWRDVTLNREGQRMQRKGVLYLLRVATCGSIFCPLALVEHGIDAWWNSQDGWW